MEWHAALILDPLSLLKEGRKEAWWLSRPSLSLKGQGRGGLDGGTGASWVKTSRGKGREEQRAARDKVL